MTMYSTIQIERLKNQISIKSIFVFLFFFFLKVALLQITKVQMQFLTQKYEIY